MEVGTLFYNRLYLNNDKYCIAYIAGTLTEFSEHFL